MQKSYIVCKYCYSIAPPPFHYATDDEALFEKMLNEIRKRNVACPRCGGHKWIRKVARKL
jgi:DNA-directed RNA polymerase subunit RPC12/RpoP